MAFLRPPPIENGCDALKQERIDRTLRAIAIVVIACDKREAFAQGSASYETIQRYRETGLLR
jgi:hypothetical protein